MGPAVMYWQVNADCPSLIGPMDVGDIWFFLPSSIGKDVTFTDEEAVEAIRKSTGIDLPYEVLSSDEWVASRLLADSYRTQRVFLAGDACHLHPPFGGYGMNMGVADGVDLGWKLAAVLQGWGGAKLLDSYVKERRPVHQFVMDEAVANHATLGNDLWQDGMEDADNNEYKGFAIQMKTAALEIVDAAKLDNYDKARAAVGNISQACSKCHEGFRG